MPLPFYVGSGYRDYVLPGARRTTKARRSVQDRVLLVHDHLYKIKLALDERVIPYLGSGGSAEAV